MKILLAYDSTDPSRRAAETAIMLARATGATVDVVSVVPHRLGRAPVDPWDDREAHDKALFEARDLLREAGIEPRLIEPVGDPARRIEEVAERGYDMLVVGSRDQGAVGRALQGSVSAHVATHAHTTVVIAR
ncbi:MAG TPA: universal stress protein [Candidatus Limnocylindrales bacterium]|nr:universal stress protein [Candidatus Limnocylindrales bacterium]